MSTYIICIHGEISHILSGYPLLSGAIVIRNQLYKEFEIYIKKNCNLSDKVKES